MDPPMAWGEGDGGQPPFDPRKVPESVDDIASDRPIIGCLLVLAILVFISVLLFVLDVTI